MFRRATGSLTPSAALSAAALAAAGLLAAAPLAQADPAPTDPTPTDDPAIGVSLLNDLTVLPVQACGIDASIPILSDVLDPTDAAPDASCAVVHHGGDAPGTHAGTGQ